MTRAHHNNRRDMRDEQKREDLREACGRYVPWYHFRSEPVASPSPTALDFFGVNSVPSLSHSLYHQWRSSIPQFLSPHVSLGCFGKPTLSRCRQTPQYRRHFLGQNFRFAREPNYMHAPTKKQSMQSSLGSENTSLFCQEDLKGYCNDFEQEPLRHMKL
jgi:hypothetical protein